MRFPRNGVALLAFACALLTGCHARAWAERRGPPVVDLGSKPGALRLDEVVVVRSFEPRPGPRVSGIAGAAVFDGALDLDPSAFVGARLCWPIGGGWEVDAPVKVALATHESRAFRPRQPPQPPQPPSTQTTTDDDEGTVVLASVGLRRRFALAELPSARTSATIGVAVGAGWFTGFGDDDDECALAGSVDATLEWRVSPRLAFHLDAQFHAIDTDFSSDHRAWRPAATLALGATWTP